MKTAISIPNSIFKSVEEASKKMKISRSALFTRAVEEFLQRNYAHNVTQKLNTVYSNEDSKLSNDLVKMQSLSIEHEEEW